MTTRVAALIVAASACVACAPKPPSADLDYRANVVAAKVALGDVERVLAATGVVRATEEAKVVTEAGGRIRLERAPGTTRKLAVGDRVRHGQVLAVVAAAELGVNARIEARRSTLEFARADLERHRRLRDEGLDPQTAFLDAQNRLATAQAEYDAARLAEGKSRVLAPIDGVVTMVTNAADGEYVNERTVIAEVMDFARVIVDLDLGAGEVLDVKPGQEARIRPPAGEAPARGVVERVAPAVDRTSRTFRVEVGLDNPGWLRPGMLVRADLVLAARTQVPVVPTAAVLVAGDGPQVFVVDGQVASRRAVGVGLSSEATTEIVSGLAVGDVVVVEGHETLSDGSRVIVAGTGSGAGT
jgi:RND family efflux transporter MFP subunit